MGDAVNMFFSQVVLTKGIPFEIKTPNDETKNTIKDARENKNMSTISLDKLREIGA